MAGPWIRRVYRRKARVEECCLWVEKERNGGKDGRGLGNRRGALESISVELFVHSVEWAGEGQGAWGMASGFSTMSK